MFPTREIWGSKDKTWNTLSICLLQNLNQRILLFYAIKKVKKMKVLFAQSYLTLCNPMDFSPSGSSFYGILQAKILEWVAIPLSRESSQPRDWTTVSCIAGRFFTIWVYLLLLYFVVLHRYSIFLQIEGLLQPHWSHFFNSIYSLNVSVTFC